MQKFIVWAIALVLAACNNGHKSNGSLGNTETTYEYAFEATSPSPVLYFVVDSANGGEEVETASEGGVYKATIADIAEGDHILECVGEVNGNKSLVKCYSAKINGHDQCTYKGQGDLQLTFTAPVEEDDTGCGTNPPPTNQPPPNQPPPNNPPPSGTPVPFTDVTFKFCSYDQIYSYSLTAYCSVGAFGAWSAASMTPLGPNSRCQQAVFRGVATNQTYSCNVWDPVIAAYLYNPLAVTQPNNVYLANGVSLVPNGNNQQMSIDQYGLVVWTGKTYTFTIYPNIVWTGPVIMSIGNEPDMSLYVMAPISGGWQVSIPVGYGLKEIQFNWGNNAFLDYGSEDGNFYIRDDVTPVPGIRIPQTDSITYAYGQTTTTYPYWVEVYSRNYLVNFTPQGIVGQTVTFDPGIVGNLP